MIPVKVYVIGGVIAGLVALVGVQTVRLAGVETELSKEKAGRATDRAERAYEDTKRTRLALDDALVTSKKMAHHATIQQGLTDEIHQKTARRVAAERSNGELGKRLRNANTAFTAATARNRAQAADGGAAAVSAVDRPLTLDSYVERAGELLARSADLVDPARSVVERRDSEVKALKLVVENDRALAN